MSDIQAIPKQENHEFSHVFNKEVDKKKVTEMTQTAKNQDKIQPDTSEGKEGGRLPVMLSHYEM